MEKFIEKIVQILKGRTISEVRYMNEYEKEMLGWNKGCIMIILDDGTIIYPSKDDEGNDAGALFVDNIQNNISETIPVI
jgi:hypothetical protein